MPTLDELKATARKANEAIGKIESQKRYEENKATLGKHFKYRNNYSCPEKPSDRWWLYAKVTKIDKYGYISTLQFETDKYGHISVKENDHCYHMGNGDGWNAISAAEYNRALRSLKSRIAKL